MKEIIILSKIFSRNTEEETLSSMRPALSWKYYTKRYLSWTQIQKNTQQNISKSNLLTYENDNTS